MGVTLFAALFIIMANLIVDLLYAVIDPRVSWHDGTAAPEGRMRHVHGLSHDRGPCSDGAATTAAIVLPGRS
jgi:hypothetical protein